MASLKSLLKDAVKIVEATGVHLTHPRTAQWHAEATAALNPPPKAKAASDETNPYGHPFPHHKCKNVMLTPRLIGASGNNSGHMIENDDLRNYSISGKAPA